MKRLFPMGMKFFIVLILLAFFQPVSASGEFFITNTRSLALGSIKALSTELNNPAYLSFQKQTQIGTSVYNQFQMKELNTIGCYMLMPNKWLDAGIQFSTYGYEDYRQSGLQIGLSKKISDRLALGSSFSYLYSTSIWEEKSQSNLTTNLALFWNLNESIDLAFLADNLLSNFAYPALMCHAGMNFRAFNNCLLLCEISSGEKNDWNLSAGFEYELGEKLFIRGGMRTRPRSPSFGAAYTWSKLTFDVSFLLHSSLGTSSSIRLSYQF